jgi:hypothetical protein
MHRAGKPSMLISTSTAALEICGQETGIPMKLSRVPHLPGPDQDILSAPCLSIRVIDFIYFGGHFPGHHFVKRSQPFT